MAGDWIKMRADLRRHPKVVRMVSALNADRLRVVGGLHAVWSVFDEQTEDGFLPGYTPGWKKTPPSAASAVKSAAASTTLG
jgi:hypothetical protein